MYPRQCIPNFIRIDKILWKISHKHFGGFFRFTVYKCCLIRQISCHFCQDISKIRREVTANFHRLNVLLIRIEEKNLSPVARKVAMATLSEAKIQANFGTFFTN